MPYDLSATVHHKPRRSGSGHYSAISRSRDLQSHEWFMYNDDRVSPSKFTNMQKKHAVVLKCHLKTATILFYVSPVIMVLKIAEILTWTARRATQMATAEI